MIFKGKNPQMTSIRNEVGAWDGVMSLLLLWINKFYTTEFDCRLISLRIQFRNTDTRKQKC